jgi:hypothetical protein
MLKHTAFVLDTPGVLYMGSHQVFGYEPNP